MPANVFTIAPGEVFADLLVRGVVDRVQAHDLFALADATILVPTRRAVRSLQEAFARRLGGAALLPCIRPLGDVDEDEMFFETDDSLFLPRAIGPVRRRLLLATLIERWGETRGAGRRTYGFAQAASLAKSLGGFIDEAETQEIDLHALESLAEGQLAKHWREVRSFLEFARDEWPKLLVAEVAVDPARRRNLALAALAKRLERHPQAAPVIAAGTTGSIPATAALLRVIAHLPKGAVVLPGLDRELDTESWSRLDEGHWQFGMKQLLDRIGIARDEVQDWARNVPFSARTQLVREILRPAPTTDAWRALAANSGKIAEGLSGLSLIETANTAEEATVVALILRQTLEEPGRTAALVTPDRNLARRVAAELQRWNIVIDDSAGQPLANTPPGTFLSLLAEAAREEFAPVPLLALLKHPIASGGTETAEFRRRVRELDRFVLRGPRPDSGLAGISRAIEAAITTSDDREDQDSIASLAPWFAAVASTLAPFADALGTVRTELGAIVDRHVETAEALAATPTESGASRLWRNEAGRAAAELVEALKSGSEQLLPLSPATYPQLFRMLTEEVAVRPPFGSHPRLAILGPLEARLQRFDVVVLGGLNEGKWPAATSVDPWLSRPMRKSLGLESPERRIGLSAHDFATLAAAPRVVLTRSLRADGAPTIASRWIERLKQLTNGLGLSGLLTAQEPYHRYATLLDLPEQAPTAEQRPNPRPPVGLRPRSLSVTEIETWLRDPYAIYAKHILKLRPLEPLDAEIGALERGSAIHLILERFLREAQNAVSGDALRRLLATADAVFAELAIPHAAQSVWRPKFARAAAWFVELERTRSGEIARSYLEISGRRAFAGPQGSFELRGRADRIDVLKRGGAAIIDYKTGSPPTIKQVKLLLAPQLPLEAAILAAGGFREIGRIAASELAYVRFAGGPVPGKYSLIDIDAAALGEDAADRLSRRIAEFDLEDTPYTSRVAPLYATMPGNYDLLARVLEWSPSGWKESEE